jgi:hypothetical protein
MTHKPTSHIRRFHLSLVVAGLVTRAFAQDPTFTLAPDTDHLELGSAFTAAGDLNGDGVIDVTIADRSAKVDSKIGSGLVHLVSGADGSEIRDLKGESAASQGFGSSIVAMNADGDGIPDLAVGAPGQSLNGSFGAGAVRIYSGADGSLLRSAIGSAASQMGVSLANAGDQNGDGIDDLYAGAPNADGRGAVFVISGADASVIRKIPATAVAASFGVTLATLGDIDGDGKADLAVGSPAFRASVFQEGRIELVRSSDGAIAATVTGAMTYNRLGDSMEAVPDFNGDGQADLLVGSFSGGTALLVSGTDLATLRDASISGLPLYQNVRVGGAIDFDGDGVRDFLLGSQGLAAVGTMRHGGIRIVSGADGATLFERVAAAPSTGLGMVVKVLPGLGFAAGEPYSRDAVSKGMGLAMVWQFAETPPTRDSDGDGVPDDEDKVVLSIMTSTVWFLKVDSRVPNRVDAEGVTLADRYAALGTPASCRAPGRYISKVAQLTGKLVRMKLISHREASQLKLAAVRGVKESLVRKKK